MSEPFLEPPELDEACPDCCGKGVIGTGRMSWSVNSATIDPPYEITETCKTCNGNGYAALLRERANSLSSEKPKSSENSRGEADATHMDDVGDGGSDAR